MEKAFYSLTLCFLFMGSVLNAQQMMPITKAEVLETVAGQNRSIKISEQERKEARADYQQTNAVLLPDIGISYTGFTTTNPLAAFGAKLNQEVLTSEDFNPVILNDPDRTTNYATVVEIRQPLINLDGYYQRKAAASKMRAAELQTVRTKDQLLFEAEISYMQLQLAYRSVEVLQKALETAEANQKLASDKHEQGYLQKADLLATEVRLLGAQDQLQIAQSHVKNSSDHLALLMGEEDPVLLKPADSLVVSSLIPAAITGTPGNRADIQAIRLATEAHAAAYQANKMSFLPSLNAFGSYQLYDDNLVQGEASGYMIGAQLSWNLLEGTKRIGSTQKSKAAYERSKLYYDQYVSQTHFEVNKATRRLSDAQGKLERSKLAREQSRESLRIRINRFKEGLEKTTDLLMAETQYAQRTLEYYQAIFELNYAKAYLKFLTKE